MGQKLVFITMKKMIMKKWSPLLCLFLWVTCLPTLVYAQSEVDPEKKKTTEEIVGEVIGNLQPKNPLASVATVADSALDPLEEHSAIIDRVDATLEAEDDRKLSQLIEMVEGEISEEDAAEKKKDIESIKKQNTLLWSRGNIGFYKSDAVNLGLMAAELAADIQLNRFLKKRRIEYITRRLMSIDDIDRLIEVIKKVGASHARYEERAALRLTMVKSKALDSLLNPLRNYVQENHSLAPGYVPFNKKTLLPLLARWGFEKVTTLLKEKLLVSPTKYGASGIGDSGDFFADPSHFGKRFSALWSAYSEDDKGNLTQIPWSKSPWSLTACAQGLRMLINPVQGIQKILFSSSDNPWLGRWKAIANNAGLNLPEFLFSDAMKNGLEFLGMGYSLNYWEHAMSKQWTEYVTKNRELLKGLVTNYKRLLTRASSEESELVAAREAIKNFIVKGHESTSGVPGTDIVTWWKARDSGRNMIPRVLGLGAAILVAGKAAQWWYGN